MKATDPNRPLLIYSAVMTIAVAWTLLTGAGSTPHPNRSDVAGLIFVNDEGTENGGLIFSGGKNKGKVNMQRG